MRFLDNEMGAVKSAPQPITSFSVLYKLDYEKEIRYKKNCVSFGAITQSFMDIQVEKHINVLHEIALRYDRDYL